MDRADARCETLFDAIDQNKFRIFTFKITVFFHAHTNNFSSNVSFCIIFPENVDEARRLIDGGANVNESNRGKLAPIHVAAFRGKKSYFKLLLLAQTVYSKLKISME